MFNNIAKKLKINLLRDKMGINTTSIFDTDYDQLDKSLLTNSANSSKSIFIGKSIFTQGKIDIHQVKSLAEEIIKGRKKLL